MVPMESRIPYNGVGKKRRNMQLEEKSRVWLCHVALTRKVPNDFLSLGVLSILD